MTIAGLIASSPLSALQLPAGTIRCVVFDEPGFPSVQGLGCDRTMLEQALAGIQTSFAGVRSLGAALDRSRCDLLVMPYGSAFPLEGWPAIARYLKSGGSLLTLGGVPFSVPVVNAAGGWNTGVAQTTYHKELGITQSFIVETGKVAAYHSSDGIAEALSVTRLFELYVCLASTVDHPDESGSAGTRDAVLRSLVTGHDADGKSIAAPVVCIDRLIGDFAGGRWVLVNCEGSIRPGGIRTLAGVAAEGAMELVARPTYACYYAGEVPSVDIQLRRPDEREQQAGKLECSVQVLTSSGKEIRSVRAAMKGDGKLLSATVSLAEGRMPPLDPGLYHVKTSVKVPTREDNERITITHDTGFWVYDRQLMKRGSAFTTDRTYLRRDGAAYPVTGTTYMGSDVHRKFLLEPNPWIWNRDFAAMKDAGINMVRTGMWTAWRAYMHDPGVLNESVLRSLDAFIHTARKYDIPVIMTFFAFLPELWGGENAYLDPRSVAAQKEFVAGIVRRYAEVNDLLWDLINEPSFCSPANLWSCRPNGDRFEHTAWRTWLRKKYDCADDDLLRMKLAPLYRCTPDEALGLPTMDDFGDVNILGDRTPLKVVDYRLFAQDMFTGWTEDLSSAIRRHGNPHQLITVGQDEAGTNDSPNPQFHARSVDVTCLHNWWLNDDLLWDSIVTTTPLRPNLVEETGIMFYETQDGVPWRSEEDAAHLLGRKLSIALASGSAGFIEWIWNTNPYMKSDNEAAIGLHRADGTAKPEFTVLRDIARFVAGQREWMEGRKQEDVLMVLPHSQMFSPRNSGSEATKRAVRAMCYRNRVPMRAVSEYRLAEIGDRPRLILVPVPSALTESAWRALLDLANAGSTLLVSGPVEYDEHRIPANRMGSMGIPVRVAPVTQEETLIVGTEQIVVGYRGEKLHRVEKGITEREGLPRVEVVTRGAGKVIWSPLPVELAEHPEAAARLYAFALKEAGWSPRFTVGPADSRVLVYASHFDRATLFACVSESAAEESVDITTVPGGATQRVKVAAQKAVLLLVGQSDGHLIARHG